MTRQHHGCSEYAEFSRRGFLARGAAGLASAAWLPKVALARTPRAPGTARDVLVHVALRGGTDGLSVVVPYGDPDLYVARPTLAVLPPGNPGGALDLDGFFGLNPNAAPLLTPWQNGHLAVLHAAGSTDPTRSHFDATRAMEGGTPEQSLLGVTTGWLGRHLADTPPVGSTGLRGLVLNDLMPLHMTGCDEAIPVADPGSFEFPGRPATVVERRIAIESMYQSAQEPLASAALSTLATIDLLASIDFDNYQTSGGKPYPGSFFGQQLRMTAALIKAGIDLEAVGLEYGGWDHHENLGPITGLMANMLADLSGSLEAFYLDLAATGHIDTTVLTMMSEFGRRVAENVSAGVDHGHGNMMMVLGGHIAGGQVYASWPGLSPAQLDDGDVAITTDYRDVLAEILEVRMGNQDLPDIFPNYTPTFLGITN